MKNPLLSLYYRLARPHPSEKVAFDLNRIKQELKSTKQELWRTKRELDRNGSELARVSAALEIQQAIAGDLDAVVDRQARKIAAFASERGGGEASCARAQEGPTTDAPPILLIASGSSSGSHLFAQLLAAYEPFVVGPEPNLASRPGLFAPEGFRSELLRGLYHQSPIVQPRLLSNGYLHHPIPFRLFTNDEAYLYETTDAKVHLASKATSWSGFVSMIRDRLVDAQVVPGNSVLVEHSPSAAVGIAPALRAMPNLKVVHLVRDPRDAISSMMKRREKSPVYDGISADENLQITAEQWSLLTAAALQAEEYPGYLRISYEELVLETNATMARVLDHLGHKDAKRHLAPISFGEIGHQPGWRNSPKGAISASSIGRYRETLTAEQIERLVAMEFDFPELGFGCAMRDFVDRFSSQAIPGEETDVPRTRGSA